MKPDRASPAARARLAELAKAWPTSLAGLSRMLSRNPPYLATFVREGRPERLEDHEIDSLAAFFGVDPWELGKRHGT